MHYLSRRKSISNPNCDWVIKKKKNIQGHLFSVYFSLIYCKWHLTFKFVYTLSDINLASASILELESAGHPIRHPRGIWLFIQLSGFWGGLLGFQLEKEDGQTDGSIGSLSPLSKKDEEEEGISLFFVGTSAHLNIWTFKSAVFCKRNWVFNDWNGTYSTYVCSADVGFAIEQPAESFKVRIIICTVTCHCYWKI